MVLEYTSSVSEIIDYTKCLNLHQTLSEFKKFDEFNYSLFSYTESTETIIKYIALNEYFPSTIYQQKSLEQITQNYNSKFVNNIKDNVFDINKNISNTKIYEQKILPKKNLDDILFDKGYNKIYHHILYDESTKKPTSTIPSSIAQPKEKTVVEFEEVVDAQTAIGLDIAKKLASRHPGIAFAGSSIWQNPSKHTVFAYHFRYEEDGEEKELQMLGKNTLAQEVTVARAVAQLGIPTYQDITLDNGMTIIEYLGQDTAADRVARGDHSAITGVVKTLGQFHARSNDLESFISVAQVNPVENFFNRFVSQLADTTIITPTQSRLLHAYHAFISTFTQSGVAHGDAHLRNFVHRDKHNDYGIIDFETVCKTSQLFDLARVANASEEIIGEDVSGDIIFPYMQAFGLTDANELFKELTYVQVADNLLKVGDRLTIANHQPHRAEEKRNQADETLVKAQQQLRTLINTSTGNRQNIASALEHALHQFLLESYEQEKALISA